MRIFTQIQGAAFSNHCAESVPNRRALASPDPSLAPPIAPQACPQKSRGHTETRFDHPEFDPICDHQPPFKLYSALVSPFVREHQSHPADVAPIHSALQHSTPRPSFCIGLPTRCRSCARNLNQMPSFEIHIHIPFEMCKVVFQLPQHAYQHGLRREMAVSGAPIQEIKVYSTSLRSPVPLSVINDRTLSKAFIIITCISNCDIVTLACRVPQRPRRGFTIASAIADSTCI